MAFLALSPGDAQIMVSILNRANAHRAEYDEALTKAIGARVAEAVVPPLAKSLGRLINQLARNLRG